MTCSRSSPRSERALARCSSASRRSASSAASTRPDRPRGPRVVRAWRHRRPRRRRTCRTATARSASAFLSQISAGYQGGRDVRPSKSADPEVRRPPVARLCEPETGNGPRLRRRDRTVGKPSYVLYARAQPFTRTPGSRQRAEREADSLDPGSAPPCPDLRESRRGSLTCPREVGYFGTGCRQRKREKPNHESNSWLAHPPRAARRPDPLPGGRRGADRAGTRPGDDRPRGRPSKPSPSSTSRPTWWSPGSRCPMPARSAVIERLRERFPDSAIVALTVFDDLPTVQQVLAAGADGYVLKSAATSDLFAGIRTVARGGLYLQPSIGIAFASRPPDEVAHPAVGGLTPKETDVLRLLALGHTNAEIAQLARDESAHHRDAPRAHPSEARPAQPRTTRAVRARRRTPAARRFGRAVSRRARLRAAGRSRPRLIERPAESAGRRMGVLPGRAEL